MASDQAQTAFEARLRENETDIVRYLQRRLENDADAAEAYGEYLLTAWRKRRKCPEDATPARTWLFVVARNTLLNARRSLARRSAATAEFVASLRTIPAVDPSATETLDIARALRTLPDDDAELVRLIYWDGFASHEAAAIIGLNPSTARSRLSKVKRRLRELLEFTRV